MSRVTGMCYLNLNGSKLHSKEGATLKPGGPIQEIVTDVHGVVGTATEKHSHAEVKATLIHTAELDVVALQNLAEATLVFETDTKQRYLVREASTIGELEFKGKEVEVTFGGHPAEKI